MLRLSQSFLVVLILVLASVSSFAQETGGGSTEGFKRPSNPPVHEKRKQAGEASGGKVKDGPRQGGRSSQTGNTSASAGVAPGAPGPSPTPRPRTGVLGAIGDLKSGGGGGNRGTPNTNPKAMPVPVKPKLPDAAPENAEEAVEEAIAAGNAARDQKPSDFDEAERAYKIATELAPNDARAFEGLGHIYLDQNLNEQAIAAYRKAVELQTKNPQVWESLGDAYYRLGRYNESLEASAQSVRLDPKPPGPYWTLTWASVSAGKGEDAGNFANAFLYRWRPYFSTDTPYYVALAGYLGFWEAGRKVDADKLLTEAANECKDHKWVCRLVKYLKHEVTATQLITEADTNDKMTEARTYIGIDLVLTGRREEGLAHLRWVVENGNRRFTEYPLAQRWATKLGASSSVTSHP